MGFEKKITIKVQYHSNKLQPLPEAFEKSGPEVITFKGWWKKKNGGTQYYELSLSASFLPIFLQIWDGGGAVSPPNPLSATPESLFVHDCEEPNPFRIK